MAWQLSVYSALLGLAAAVSAGICVLAWRRRDEQGSVTFLMLMAGCAVWAAGNSLQLLTTDLGLKLLFRTVGYIGHNLVPVLLLVFALVYSGHTNWVTRRNVALLAAEPLFVAFVVTPTNALGWHTTIWPTYTLTEAGGLVVLERTFGLWYWVNTAYNYALIAVALYFFVYLAVQSRSTTRKQGLALIAAVLPPLVANVAWMFGATTIDFTPTAFTITGVLFAVAIYRYRLFDLVPVAHETVLEAMDDGYVVLDTHDTVIDIDTTARRYAAAVDDPIGRTASDVVPECVDLIEEHDHVVDASDDKTTVEGTVSVTGPDDEPLYFDIRVSTIDRAQQSGRLILLRDITEQREVEQWYQTLIENASDLIAVIDADGYYTYHSPSSSRLLGYDPDELIGESIVEFIHPDDRAAVLEKFQRSVENPDYQPSHEYRFRHGDGEWIWLESRGRNHLDHPVIEGVVVNSRDVTDRKEHERTLRQQNEQLQSLASAAGHDLRNPLQVISGRLPLARETGDDRHFTALEEATDRMATLVEDIVAIARAGDFVKDLKSVNLADVAMSSWRGFDTKDADLVLEFEARSVKADRSKLRSLFENLFSNAVTHGGPDVIVRVGTTSSGFYVEDDGHGIPEDVRSEIFDRGLSTEQDGSGLGLAIVQSVATAHGWEVAYVDRGEWTRFEVSGVDTAAPAESAGSVAED